MSDTGSYSVLLVDDELPILRALRRTLRNEGYRILTSDSPGEALDILSREEVDIVIADYRMPEMTGIEFLTKVRESWPWIVRIVLTGYTEPGAAIDAINKVEAHKFLTKPWDDQELREILADAVNALQLLTTAPPDQFRTRRRSSSAFESLESFYPGITELNVDEEGTILLGPDLES